MKMKFLRNTLAAAVALMMTAPLAANAAKNKYKVIEVTGGATVSGKVMFEGALPADAIEQILITKDSNVCGTGDREVIWVDVKDGALRGSFVFLDKVKEGKDWTAPAGGVYLINQKGCRFHPWAQVIKPGLITIRNSDPGVLHNINAREMIGVEKGRVVKKGIFNFGQPDPGDLIQELKTRRGPYIGINCEAHNFMFGFMMAPSHPYAVVVGEDGSYSIDGIPPGKYTLKAWHPRYGVQKAKITVEAGGSLEQSFTFKDEG
jgi:hypothetical protein